MDPGTRREDDRSYSATDYERGLPDHHDPTAGVGGAPSAYSALTFRLVLAGFGALLGLVALVVGAMISHLLLFMAGVILAILASLNVVVVAIRKRRGDPG